MSNDILNDSFVIMTDFAQMQFNALRTHSWGARSFYSERDANPEPRQIEETVFRRGQHDGDWPPEEVAGFFAWFQAKLALVPKKHRNTARIQIDREGNYDDGHYAEIAVTYTRPETTKEIAERQEGWRKQSEAKAAERATRERAEYERLRAKFGE